MDNNEKNLESLEKTAIWPTVNENDPVIETPDLENSFIDDNIAGQIFQEVEHENEILEAQQEAVMTAMADTQKYHLDQCASFEEYAEGEFEKAGATVITLTDEEKVAFQDAVASADCESMAKELMVHPEIVDNMKAELEAYRG